MTQLRKVTIQQLRRMKRNQRRITMLTAYDATFGRLLDPEVDLILVGDSLGMVVQGHDTTIPVTLQEMAYHGRAVARVCQHAHVVVDLPFMSYHVSPQQAVESAGFLVKEGRAESVKLEGGSRRAREIEAIVQAEIPVMGHIGLTPQSFHAMGGFKVQGKGREAARRVLEDARAVEQAGAYAVVLEGIPRELAAEITETLSIPTIGIGAGPDCDGQVLVIYDLLGMDDRFTPRFVKRYAEVGEQVRGAVRSYVSEVRSGAFPEDRHSFHARKKAVRKEDAPRLEPVAGSYGPRDEDETPPIGRVEGA